MTDKEIVENIKPEYKFLRKKCEMYLEKNGGVLPMMFNPYNNYEITDYAPTLTTSCDRSVASSTVIIKCK